MRWKVFGVLFFYAMTSQAVDSLDPSFLVQRQNYFQQAQASLANAQCEQGCCRSFCASLQSSLTQSAQTWTPADQLICDSFNSGEPSVLQTCSVPVSNQVYQVLSGSSNACNQAQQWQTQCQLRAPGQVSSQCLAYQTLTEGAGAIPAEAVLIGSEGLILATCLGACFAGDVANPVASAACNIGGMADSIAELVLVSRQLQSPVNQAISAVASATALLQGGALAQKAGVLLSRKPTLPSSVSPMHQDPTAFQKLTEEWDQEDAQEKQKASAASDGNPQKKSSSNGDNPDTPSAAEKKVEKAAGGPEGGKAAEGGSSSQAAGKAGVEEPDGSIKAPPATTKKGVVQKIKERSSCATALLMGVMVGLRSAHLGKFLEQEKQLCRTIKNYVGQGAGVLTGGSVKTSSTGGGTATGTGSSGFQTLSSLQAFNQLPGAAAWATLLNLPQASNGSTTVGNGSAATAAFSGPEKALLSAPGMTPLLQQAQEAAPQLIPALLQGGLPQLFQTLKPLAGPGAGALPALARLAEAVQADPESVPSAFKPAVGGFLASGSAASSVFSSGGKPPSASGGLPFDLGGLGGSLSEGLGFGAGGEKSLEFGASTGGGLEWDPQPLHAQSKDRVKILEQVERHWNHLQQGEAELRQKALQGVGAQSGTLSLPGGFSFDLEPGWTCLPDQGDWVCYRSLESQEDPLLLVEVKAQATQEEDLDFLKARLAGLNKGQSLYLDLQTWNNRPGLRGLFLNWHRPDFYSGLRILSAPPYTLLVLLVAKRDQFTALQGILTRFEQTLRRVPWSPSNLPSSGLTGLTPGFLPEGESLGGGREPASIPGSPVPSGTSSSQKEDWKMILFILVLGALGLAWKKFKK